MSWSREPSGLLALQKLQEHLVKLLQLDLRLKIARMKSQMRMDADADKPVD